MYGAYATSDSQDRNGPECSTYPRSIGRPGGLGLFSRRWGNRLREDLKPMPMKWNFDEENDEDSPDNHIEIQHVTDTATESIEDHDTECNDEVEEEDQSIPVFHGSHHEKVSLAGSVSKQRTHFIEATYPTSRHNRSGAFNSFSSFAKPVKGSSNEATPWKSFLKTEEKMSICEKESESMLMKTPFPERSVSDDNSNFCGDSGIGTTTSKALNATKKSSARGLFTPGEPRSVHSETQNGLSGFMPLQNKLFNLEDEICSRKPKVNNSTPLLPSKAGDNQQVPVEETPIKTIPLERTDIMELVKIHKSEKKCVKNSSHFENMFNEANKENFSYGMQHNLGSLQGQENEKEEIKLIRSVSHASILKHEHGKMVTPSKEDKPSSAKSLSNLFHPNQNAVPKLNQHSSRIPTPIRSHTPQKHNPKTVGLSTDSVMETSCVEMLDLQTPVKHAYSPHTAGVHEQQPNLNPASKPVAGISLGQLNPSLNNPLIPLADKAPASSKEDASLTHTKQESPPIQYQHSLTASNTRMDQEMGVSSAPHHVVHTNGLQSHAKTSSFAFTDIALNKQANPSCMFQSAAKSLEPQANLMQRQSVNTVGINEPAPMFAVPAVSWKPFSLRAPSFNPSQAKNDLTHDSKINPSVLCTPSSLAAATSQTNQNHFQWPSSHSFREPSAAIHRAEEVKHHPHLQNMKVNYFHTNSQTLEKQHVYSTVPASISALGNTQPTAYDQQAFLNSKSHAAISTQQSSAVNSSSLPLNSCDSGKPSFMPSSLVVQAVENPQPVENLSMPQEVKLQPIRKVNPSARPVSVQTNRKILVVNKKNYEVLRLLGKGASSKVYDVLDCQTNRCVAVKRVVLRQGDASVEGYLKEVELLSQLQGSECIIRLIDSEICMEKEYKVLYMVLERGEMDLSTSIKLMSVSGNQQMPSPAHPGGKIPTVTVIYYWVSMLNAVHEIHQKGIVHSDLKPANFLLVGGQVKLIDFGIATAVQVDVTSVVKDDPAGTPNYMSPEAIGLTVSGSPNSQDMFKNPKASYKSDVWSLGCILYSLVYGRSPFQHIMNERRKLDAICNPNYAIPFPSNCTVHPPLLRAMKRCLVRNYKERASIAELKSIDYLCGSELDEESWNNWKAMATMKILNALSPDCKMQAIKVIQEVFQSPPKRRSDV